MNNFRIIFVFLFVAIFRNIYLTSSVSAQVIPDRTLGDESSVVKSNVTVKDKLVDLIESGAIRGDNLFHSFTEFNIPDGQNVYFANPDGIANIFTRVTGNNISEIFGTLGVDGAANLFLLNPNGIVFGENAALDVSGSFLGTTAESYLLNTVGTEFSAADPQSIPLLNINLTPGLQMGANSGKITIENSGHLLIGGAFFPIQNNTPAPGLQIDRSKTLSLVGSEIELNGGIIQTAGGNIELRSIKQGNVRVNFDSRENILDTSKVIEFGDIKLADRALLDTSGVFAGNVSLQGENIILEDASAITVQNLGGEPSGKINVKANNSIELSGTIRNAPDIITPQGNITGVATSQFITETLNQGKSGDVVVSGKNLSVSDGGFIVAKSYSNADTGSIEIDIEQNIDVDGFSTLNPDIPTSIGTATFNSGDADAINVLANNINLTNSGAIISVNFGSGRGGDLNIRVKEKLELSGVNSINNLPSALSSTNSGDGNSGNFTINVSQLLIKDGGRIGTVNLSQGNAGKMIVNAADYIEITGATSDRLFKSSIESDTSLSSQFLRQLLGLSGTLRGNSGDIVINTLRLFLSNGGEITVNNEGLGDSGSLIINSDRITLDSSAKITAFSASGQGGNIQLDVANFISLNNSAITAETTANMSSDLNNIDGGNIEIDTNTLTLLNKSQINANAINGDGGNIEINTQGYFISTDSLVSASSEFGLDGNINVENINSDRTIALDSLPESPINAAEQITAGCSFDSDFAIAGSGGLPPNPLQALRSKTIWQDFRLPEIKDSEITMRSGKAIENQILVEAKTWKINSEGNVELIADAAAIAFNSDFSCWKEI